MQASAFLAFTTGLLGGFGHCLGMCGPILSALSLQAPHQTSFQALRAHLMYHSGRLCSYSLIGGIMGFTGSFVNVTGKMSGLQNLSMTLAGVFMILMGLGMTGILPSLVAILECRNSAVLKSAGTLFRRPGEMKFLPLGLVLGFMPCGLSYSIFIAASGSGNSLSGTLIALCFGLGTLPSLLFLGLATSFISNRLRGILYQLGALAVIASGLYYLFLSWKLYAHL